MNWHKKKNENPQAEIEQITTELIEETRDILQKSFDKVMEKKTGPLTEEEAQVILRGLIKEAVANRRLFSGRIEKSVESGSLFDRYYGKMQTINLLTNRAYVQMQKMQISKERYEFLCGIYKKLTGKMYVPDMIPDDVNGTKPDETQYMDIWEVLEKEKKIIPGGK